jgi:hypothetical protein
MDFLVAGNSLGRDLDEEEDYGLQTLPPAVPANEVRKPAIPSAVSPVENVLDVPEGERSAPMTEAEEVALYQKVMREEELQKEAARKKALEEEEEEEESEEPERVAWRPEKPPPRGLFRREFMRFFFNVELLIRLGFLAAVIFFSLFVLDKALAFINVPNMGIASFAAWFGGMMFLALSIILGIGCFFYAAALAMSILLDTGNGLKRIESWPRGFFFDWLLEAGYLAGALFWSMLPGVPLCWVLEESRIPPVLIFAATAAVIFPLALMAELDAGVFCFPGAPAVWLSPFRARRAWLDFYLMTTPLIMLVAGVAAYAFLEDIAWMLFLTSILAAAGWLLYFRLLGRLAWYASGKAETSE